MASQSASAKLFARPDEARTVLQQDGDPITLRAVGGINIEAPEAARLVLLDERAGHALQDRVQFESALGGPHRMARTAGGDLEGISVQGQATQGLAGGSSGGTAAARALA